MRVLVAILIPLLMLTSCSFLADSTRHSVDAAFSVKVTDRNIRRLTNVTQRADVEVKGKFKSGSFLVNGLVLSIPEDTSFAIDLELPIDNPAEISTRNARGRFSTSKQISIDAVPCPRTVEVQKGRVSAEISLAQTLTAFFLNLIQAGSPGGSMKDMIDNARFEKVELFIRPDSQLELGTKKLHLVKGSHVELLSADIDRNLNYRGRLHLNFKFGDHCLWPGEKVDCFFEGGDADLILDAVKSGDVLTLNLPSGAKSEKSINLESCKFAFGKEKRSSATAHQCAISLNKLKWEDASRLAHPNLNFGASMDMISTDLLLKTDIHETRGHFEEPVPGTLDVAIDQKDRGVHFTTSEPALASNATITIAKEPTIVKLTLGDTLVGPVDFGKSGSLSFELEGGATSLKELDWQASGGGLNLKCGSNSVLTVPREMYLAKAEGSAKTRLKMPLSLDLGEATLKLKQTSVKLSRLKGNLNLEVGDGISIRSDLDFTLAGSRLLGGKETDVLADGLDLSVVDGMARVDLKKCSVTIPDLVLEEAIRQKVPRTMSIKLNKTLREDRKWRYRHVVADRVSVEDFTIGDLVSGDDQTLKFTASGDVEVTGTVEKGGLVFHKDDGWKQCPWTLSGRATGKGTARYKFRKEPNSPLEMLDYDLAMQFELPDNVELDWSKVAGGILKVAEKKVILGHLKEVKVPVSHSGSLAVFQKDDPLWRNLRVKDLSIKDRKDGVQIEFSASEEL
ncbi:MAG: hypothetical protein KC777_06565 [Cyanobacteria bacterium HKST-UBA02]|nr:hypothetical protein [Cyanobacteria bacterium HKST-UBA02]